MAKKYCENLFTENQTFQDDMGIGKSDFEIANNGRESRSHRPPFDGRCSGGSTIGSMPSLSGTRGQSVQGAAQRDIAWTEYVNTLEDSLTDSKEFVASITSNPDTLVREMQEKRKQMRNRMVQNTKLMDMHDGE